jgi:hypothetical protein
MSIELYYTPPSDDIFDDLKSKAIALLQTYDDSYDYANEKISKIENLENVSDNFMYILGMFDHKTQYRLIMEINKSTYEAITKRLEY